jgi:hypothetical protein
LDKVKTVVFHCRFGYAFYTSLKHFYKVILGVSIAETLCGEWLGKIAQPF